MREVRPSVESASLVLIGDFNPKIFQPAWLASTGLVMQGEADEAELEIVHPEVSKFRLPWVELQVTRQRFSATTPDTSHFPTMRDLVVGVFRLLEHTPVKRMGINNQSHIELADEKAWHELGDTLAPKEPWSGILEEPGMRSIGIQSQIRDGWLLNVRVEPSRRTKRHGIYVDLNLDIVLGDDAALADYIDIVEREALGTWQQNLHIAKQVAEIKVNHGSAS